MMKSGSKARANVGTLTAEPLLPTVLVELSDRNSAWRVGGRSGTCDHARIYEAARDLASLDGIWEMCEV